MPLFPVTGNLRYIVQFDITGVLFNVVDFRRFLQITEKSISLWIEHLLSTSSKDAVQYFMLHTKLLSNLPCNNSTNLPCNNSSNLPCNNYTNLPCNVSTNLPCNNCTNLSCNNSTKLSNVSIHAFVDFFIESPIHRLQFEEVFLRIHGLNIPICKNQSHCHSLTIYKPTFTLDKNETHKSDSDEGQCYHSSRDEINIAKYGKYRSTFITQCVICRLVRLTADEYVYYQNKSEIQLVNYNQQKFASTQFMIGTNNTVLICVDDLLSFVSKGQSSKSSTEFALEILTVVCTCVSMACLLLTFITYCCFEALRTLPGKNNMCLIFALFIAQMCLQFGTIWTNYPTLCKVIGIVLHLFWLTTFGCMNICSYHMFHVFTDLKPMVDKSESNKRFTRYVLYSFGVPLAIVVLNLALNLGISNGNNIGYGDDKCFINNSLSQIITFISPIACICIINIMLFSVTAYKIRSAPNVRNTNHDQHDLIVYVKLFALTGITWIGQIIDSFLPLSIFTFTVTLVTGLQGLFIFLSYACNKRVFQMCRNMFKREDAKRGPADRRSKPSSQSSSSSHRRHITWNINTTDIDNTDSNSF